MNDKISWITYSASGAAVIGGLTLNDWAAIIGTIVAILSFLNNIWHKREIRRIARITGVHDE